MKRSLVLLLFCLCSICRLTAQQEVTNGFISEGIKLHDKGDYTGAIGLYKKALALNPTSAYANYEIASSYLALKNFPSSIRHSDRVIAAGMDYLDQAYIIKGTALDLSGKPREAVTTYRKAIQRFPANHLLHYNLALTYHKLKEFPLAEDALQKALKANPHHASSHLLLGNTMILQDKRVQGMMALYNFLLLEPKGNRSVSALNALEEQFKKRSKKDAAATGDFYLAEIMLETFESARTNEANRNKTWHAFFAEKTNSFFEILGDLKKDKKDFWWNFYADYFSTLASNGHTEPFSYYITQAKDDIYTGWMQSNTTKMEAFSEWYTKYLHKF
jgi:TPR repeat/Tetratricopeptide repeat